MADTIFSVITAAGDTVNYLVGEYGGLFHNTSGETVVLTEVGVWKTGSATGTRTYTVYDRDTGSVLGTGSVDQSAGTTAAFQYDTPTNSPISIPSGEGVYILPSWPGGSINFSGPNLQSVTIQDIGRMDQASRSGGGVFSSAQNSNRTYGPITFKFSAPVPTWTYDAITNEYTTDGTYFQVRSALNDSPSHPDSTVLVPSGTFAWGGGGNRMVVPAGITLKGEGVGNTIINMATDSPSGFSTSLIVLNEGSVFDGIRLNGPDASNCVPFNSSSGANDWVIKNFSYYQYSGRSSYFILANNVTSALICDGYILGGSGSSELILARGPTDAWDHPAPRGTANNLFVERVTFDGPGYVCDANSNASMVVRYCTPLGSNQIDLHGLASNTPAQSGRSMEAYNNHWTYLGATWTALNLRGGAIMAFRNVCDNTGGYGWFYLTEYGYLGYNPNFGNVFQTPYNYPIGYQIGTTVRTPVAIGSVVAGQMVQVTFVGDTDWAAMGGTGTLGAQFVATGPGSGSGTVTSTIAGEKAYVFGNERNGGVWVRTQNNGASTVTSFLTNTAGYSIGATSITLASRTNAGPANGQISAGNAVAFAGDNNRYIVTVGLSNGSSSGTIQIASPGLVQAIPASAVSMSCTPNILYQKQLSDHTVGFDDADVIESNRDVFADAGFDTNTGVVVGPIASIGSAVGKTNQGYWATDEGNWNATVAPNTSGQLYVSNGATWDLYYTPYTYPHPLSDAAPSALSASINTAGTELTVTLSESCTTGSGGSGGMALTASGGASTATYSSGSGSASYVFTLSRTINAGESITLAYTQPGAGIESTDDQIDLPSFTGMAVTNNSTVNPVIPRVLMNRGALGGGF